MTTTDDAGSIVIRNFFSFHMTQWQIYSQTIVFPDKQRIMPQLEKVDLGASKYPNGAMGKTGVLLS